MMFETYPEYSLVSHAHIARQTIITVNMNSERKSSETAKNDQFLKMWLWLASMRMMGKALRCAS
jgi:hypothetical protein